MQEAKFLEKARETYKFHRSRLLSHDKWRIQDTAKQLRRSLGSISEDLLIIRSLKKYEKEMNKFDTAKEALEFIREKQKEEELDLD